MQFDRPFQVLAPTGDGDVLSVLAGADAEFTEAEVHRLVGRLSLTGTRKILRRLANQGIVQSRRTGRGSLYRLNREHLACGVVMELARLRETLIEKISDAISLWVEPPVFAALFGSAARGEAQPDSDIDIFVVRPDSLGSSDQWDSQLFELGRVVSSWTGNDAQVLEYSETEVAQALKIDDGVLGSITEEGVRLAGPSSYLQTLRLASA